MNKKTIDRFWSKVDKTSNPNGCWEWIGRKGTGNYGVFWFQDKWWRSHRWCAKYINNMNIDNLFVCHRCDNPSCVNPEHLFLGTHKDNMDDMMNKGRKAIPNKPCKTPLGLFLSRLDAAKAHSCSPALINANMKKYPNEYYYL